MLFQYGLNIFLGVRREAEASEAFALTGSKIFQGKPHSQGF